jgi:type IV pilus assembly protein PilA
MNTYKTLRRQLHTEAGFTLIELLIVMSVILILMTLAIPQALKVRKQANETSAMASVRNIGSAETSYASAYPANGYAASLTELGPGTGAPTAQAAQLINQDLASGVKSGYLFTIVGTNKVTVNNQDMYNGFLVTAVPASVGHSGDRGYCMDESGVIKYDPAGGTNCTTAIQ